MSQLPMMANPSLGILLIFYLLVWVVSHLVSDTNLDPTGDMLENFVWAQEFSWGEAKHPPLVGWVTGIWFDIWPRNQLSYHILAYGNVALGLAGIYVLGKRLRLEKVRLPAVLLIVLALPYSTLAVKFNANTILLAIWPWLTVAWLISIHEAEKYRWWIAVALGILAALSLLGKYYSGVLLATMGLLTLATAAGRGWLKKPDPWLALVVFCSVLAPHINWLVDNDFITFKYVQEQGDGAINYNQLFKFALAPFVYWLLAFAATLIVIPKKTVSMIWRSWLPQGETDVLFWLTWLPFLFSLGFGLSGFVSLSSPWAIPLGYCFSLLWLRNLTQNSSDDDIEVIVARGRNVFLGFHCLVLVLSPIYAWQQGTVGQKNYYNPVEEAVLITETLWQEKYDQEFLWVGGDYQLAGAMVFYGSNNATVEKLLPAEPNSSGIIICALGRAELAVTSNFCTRLGDRWSAPKGSKILKVDFTAIKAGPRFTLEIPHNYRVFFYEH